MQCLYFGTFIFVIKLNDENLKEGFQEYIVSRILIVDDALEKKHINKVINTVNFIL